MSPDLFSFIWRYSARDQLLLLVLTCASFLLLYAALSLPKLIFNGAIEGRATSLDADLPELSQLSLLSPTCSAGSSWLVLEGYDRKRPFQQPALAEQAGTRRRIRSHIDRSAFRAAL